MFYLKKIRGNLRAPIHKLKDYMIDSRELNQKSKEDFVEDSIRRELNTFYNSSCGVYLDVKSLKVLKMYEDPTSYTFIKVDFEAQVYFYKVSPKEIIDFKVSRISPKMLEGTLYNSKVEILKSQISNSLPVYSAVKNCFEIGKEKIKEGDVLRSKVTSVVSQSLKDYKYPNYKIKASCRNVGTGKQPLK